jgi:hypothetical protein
MPATIINTPLVQLRGRVSTRVRNLLLHRGFETVAQVRLAQERGELRDIRRLGPGGRREIAFALADLDDEPPGAVKAAPMPGLSTRELKIILRLAESGLREGVPGSCSREEAQAALEHLHVRVHGTSRTGNALVHHAPESPSEDDPIPAHAIPVPDWPEFLRSDDDGYAGYEIDPGRVPSVSWASGDY